MAIIKRNVLLESLIVVQMCDCSILFFMMLDLAYHYSLGNYICKFYVCAFLCMCGCVYVLPTNIKKIHATNDPLLSTSIIIWLCLCVYMCSNICICISKCRSVLASIYIHIQSCTYAKHICRHDSLFPIWKGKDEPYLVDNALWQVRFQAAVLKHCEN